MLSVSATGSPQQIWLSAANVGEEGRDGEREVPETLHGDSQMAQENKEE